MTNIRSFRFVTIIISTLLLSVSLFAGGRIASASGLAAIGLSNYDAKYSYTHVYNWTLRTTAGPTTMTGNERSTQFNVSATKTSGATTFTVHGGFTLTNTGTDPATIGNIVVNLQKANTKSVKSTVTPWVSIAADVANSTFGDAATQAAFVASASQENTGANSALGARNYTISGSKGVFTETVGSGSLEITDSSNNTAYSLVPQVTIASGESLTLLYTAGFKTSVLPPAGTALRVETLVSLGNASGGSAAANIDISGNGVVSWDEANVLTVPVRTQMDSLPSSPEEYYSQVAITDSPDTISATGTVSVSNVDSFDTITICSSDILALYIDYTPGYKGGQITNVANLHGAGSATQSLGVITGYSSDNTAVYATYESCPPIDLGAYARLYIKGTAVPDFTNGDFVTFGQGGWGQTLHGKSPYSPGEGSNVMTGNPARILAAYFDRMYPDGSVIVGVTDSDGYWMEFTSADAVAAYLPAGGTSAALNANLVNPTASHAGIFGGQVLSLQLNVDYNDCFGNDFRDLYLCNTSTSLDGLTVSEVLDLANIVLGGEQSPDGMSISDLSNMVNELNNTFANGIPDTWALAHLSR